MYLNYFSPRFIFCNCVYKEKNQRSLTCFWEEMFNLIITLFRNFLLYLLRWLYLVFNPISHNQSTCFFEWVIFKKFFRKKNLRISIFLDSVLWICIALDVFSTQWCLFWLITEIGQETKKMRLSIHWQPPLIPCIFSFLKHWLCPSSVKTFQNSTQL